MTVGQAASACRRKVTSGPVNSLDASDTRITASAVGSAASVLAEWLDARPPTPGVSTKTRPSLRIDRGQQRLGADDGSAVGALDVTADGAGHLLDRDRHLLRLGQGAAGRRRPRREQEGAGGLGAVAHLHRHRGRHVVVDRAYRSVDQRVDELALALFELPDHEHPDRRVREPAGRVPQPSDEIVAPLLLAE
jgi:hypothetical protein